MEKIKADELMIGNIVYSATDKKDIIVNGCDIFLCENKHHREEQFQPIELSSAWFFIFGFKVDSDRDGSYYVKNGFKIIFLNNYDGSIRLFGNIKYVHQLQNGYYLDTGEKLNGKI